MADSALLAVGGADAPLSYAVPGATAIRIKQVHVSYVDNGAGGDWLPAVRIVSDSSHRMGTASDQAVKVTAGSDAAVSFFPGVKHAAAGFTGAVAARSSLYQSRGANQAIPSGALTAIVFTTFTSTPGWTPGLFGHPAVVQNPITFAAFGPAMFTLIVDFEAANYDRYVEMTIANPDIAQAGRSPRIRSQVTPDGDRLVLSAVLEGGTGAPATTITANVFQASGVNRNITATWIATEFNSHITLI